MGRPKGSKNKKTKVQEQSQAQEMPVKKRRTRTRIKNKATNPNRKLSKFAITYDKGLDGYIDTINMAITYGVIEQAGAWFSFFEQDGSIVNSEADELCKCQGKSSLVDYLSRNKDVYERIQNRLNEEITKDD